jgi:O-antigen/teichoic acid export membrane protein
MITNVLALIQNSSLLLFLNNVSPDSAERNIIVLAWANVICISLPDIIATVIAFSTKLRDIRPSIFFFNKEYAKSIFSLGLTFFLIQFLGLFTAQIDIFITRIFSSADVVEFQIYNRIFSLITLLFTLAMAPLWSAVTKAVAQKRYVWIKKLFKLIFLLSIILSLLIVAIIPILGFIFKLWLGSSAPTVNLSYAFIMAFYSSVVVFCTAWGTISMGMNIVKPYLITRGIAVLLKIPLTYALSSVLNNWSSVIFAIVLIHIPEAVATPFIVYKILKKKENEIKNVH